MSKDLIISNKDGIIINTDSSNRDSYFYETRLDDYYTLNYNIKGSKILANNNGISGWSRIDIKGVIPTEMHTTDKGGDFLVNLKGRNALINKIIKDKKGTNVNQKKIIDFLDWDENGYPTSFKTVGLDKIPDRLYRVYGRYYDPQYNGALDHIKFIDLNEGITYIGKEALPRYGGNYHVEFPTTLQDVPYGVDGKIDIKKDHVSYNTDRNGNIFIARYSDRYSWYHDIEVEPGTKFIAPNCFNYDRTVTSIKLPPSVKKVYLKAFRECEKLTNVNLENVDYLGSYILEDVTGVKKLELTNLKTSERALDKSFVEEVNAPNYIRGNLFNYYYTSHLKKINAPKMIEGDIRGINIEELNFPSLENTSINNCNSKRIIMPNLKILRGISNCPNIENIEELLNTPETITGNIDIKTLPEVLHFKNLKYISNGGSWIPKCKVIYFDNLETIKKYSSFIYQNDIIEEIYCPKLNSNSGSSIYYNCPNLKIAPNKFLFEEETDLSNAFYNCPKLRGTLELKNINYVNSRAISNAGYDKIIFYNLYHFYNYYGNTWFISNCPNLNTIEILDTLPNKSSSGLYKNYIYQCPKLETFKDLRETSLGSLVFETCPMMKNIIIPNYTQVYADNFTPNIEVIDFTDRIKDTIPSIYNSLNINNINPNLKILVPTRLFDKWIKYTNWTLLEDHIIPADPVVIPKLLVGSYDENTVNNAIICRFNNLKDPKIKFNYDDNLVNISNITIENNLIKADIKLLKKIDKYKVLYTVTDSSNPDLIFNNNFILSTSDSLKKTTYETRKMSAKYIFKEINKDTFRPSVPKNSYAMIRFIIDSNGYDEVQFKASIYSYWDYSWDDILYFGKLDTDFKLNSEHEYSDYYKSFHTSRNDSDKDYKIINYGILPPGKHYIDVKFLRGSNESFSPTVIVDIKNNISGV